MEDSIELSCTAGTIVPCIQSTSHPTGSLRGLSEHLPRRRLQPPVVLTRILTESSVHPTSLLKCFDYGSLAEPLDRTHWQSLRTLKMTTSPNERDIEDSRYELDISEDEQDDDAYPIEHYDLVSSPNDFNTKTLVDFIDSGVVNIPGFQRNFVWDVKRASRLIESIIVGLPVPQIFLYEQGRDSYLVIDGQQRLMSIYYFVKGRFPRKDKLLELRSLLEGQSTTPNSILNEEEYFSNFRLSLPESIPGHVNRFHRLSYVDFDDSQQTSFNLRTIRHIIVRQVGPAGDDAMYEIFNRLNSGGINLTPQEIRRCTFDSPFYDMLYRTNMKPEWRDLVGTRNPDIHMRDVEILLRGFAVLIAEDCYRPSMVKFLNSFSQQAKSYSSSRLEILEQLLLSFLSACEELPNDAFHSTQGRFSPMIFESVFVAACGEPYQNGGRLQGRVSLESLHALKNDEAFRNATRSQTTSQRNVRTRLSRARELVYVQ